MARLIDTSVLVSLERRGGTLEQLFGLMGPDEPVALSVVTVSELLVGVHLSNNEARRIAKEIVLNAILEVVPVLPFDLLVGRTYARILADLRISGRMIGLHDAQIAATALTHGYGVLTNNAGHFERVPGLSVTTPRWE